MTQSWGVYLLRCADGTLYCGATNDLQRRVALHRTGRASRYTRARLPVEIVYWEAADDRGAALRREAQIKRWPAPRKRALAKTAGDAVCDA